MLEDLATNAFPLPLATQVTTEYPNLKDCEEHKRVNFRPTKRPFKRVVSAQENESALKRALKGYWGFDEFRDQQLDICVEVMKGNDVFVNAPTGLGKSVCFQVPAVTMEHGITLVIVPLIALMHDQIDALQEKGIQAASLCSSTPPHEIKEVKRQLRMGHPKLRLLYTTPETLFGTRYEQDFRRCFQQKQLARMVIDEAHVIDDWGWAFRPEFRQLGRFREMFPDVPISAFTASARSETREHICRVLGIRKGHYAQFVFPVNRKNLFYEVKHRGKEDDEERIVDVIQTIKKVQAETKKRGRPTGVGIVYCSFVETCKTVRDRLQKAGIAADLYHAKMSDAEKAGVQEAFKHGMIECIVATIAFGMGIDKADVRYVIHFQCPAGIESYYQETGRAGRDGHMSRCIIYYSREDARSRRLMVDKTAKEAVRKCDSNGEREQGEDFARRYKNSFKSASHPASDWADDQLQAFAESITVCRHVALARYFEETGIDPTNQAHLEAYCNKMCDVCANRAAVFRRATNINEELEPCSQIVPAPARLSVIDSESEPPSSEVGLPDTLHDLHSQDLIPKTQAKTPVAGPTSSLRTPMPGRMPFASVTSSLVPSPLGQIPHLQSPRTPVPVNAAERKGKRPMAVQTSAEVVAPGPGVAGPSAIRRLPAGQSPRTPMMVTPVDRRTQRAMTFQDIAEGSYAVPDAPPPSKKKREQQHDKFMSTEAVEGDGPYGYYAASSSTNARPRSHLRPSTFKTPFRQKKPRYGNMTILAERRAKGLSRILNSLKSTMLIGELADRIWAYWKRDTAESKGRRRRVLNNVAQTYEAELVQQCDNRAEYERNIALIEKVFRMLLTEQGVHALTSNELQEDHGEREEIKVLLDIGQRIRQYA